MSFRSIEDAALDREARDRRAVGAADLRDDVRAVRRELGDLRNPDRPRKPVSGADPEAGDEKDRDEKDGEGPGAACAHAPFSHAQNAWYRLARGGRMTESTPPPVPAPQIPKLPTTLPFEDEAARTRRAGCLKWGLVGCAGASVLVIVGLLFVLSNAKKFMGLAFEKIGDEVVATAVPEVTPAEKERFRAALTAFAERAKAQKVSADRGASVADAGHRTPSRTAA
jgi:hypothetical protein